MATAADYESKVQAYFVATLGRPASTKELSDFSTMLLNNNGAVFKGSDGLFAKDAGSLKDDLVSYLETQPGYPTGTDYPAIVNELYKNLTGSEAPAAALSYYADFLQEGTIKLRGLVNAIVNDGGYMPRNDGSYGQPPLGWGVDPETVGATADLLEVVKLKVIAAKTFTTALEGKNNDITTASGRELAKAWMDKVVDADSAAAATAASAEETISEIEEGEGEPGEEPGETNTLTEAMDALDAAKKAVADFLVDNEYVNGSGDADASALAGLVNSTGSGVDTAISTAKAGSANTSAVNTELGKITGATYSDESESVQASLKADTLTKLNKAATEAGKAVDAAWDDIDEVDGLRDAIEGYQSAEAELTEAQDANTEAKLNLDAEIAKFNALNELTGGAALASSSGPYDFTSVFDEGDDKPFTINSSSKDLKGIDVLLDLANAQRDTQQGEDDAQEARNDAAIALNKFGSTAVTALGNGFTIETPADKDHPTEAEVAAEVTALIGALVAKIESESSLVLADGDFIIAQDPNGEWKIYDGADGTTALDPEDLDGEDVSSELEALNDFQDLINDVNTDDGTPDDTSGAGGNLPLYGALVDAQADVETVDGYIEDFNDAIEAYEAALADQATLDDLNADIEAAEAWFTDNGYDLPTELTTGTNAATADDDIFTFSNLASSSTATISNFGKDGTDHLFVGKDFSFDTDSLTDVAITKANIGNAAEFEIFAKQIGSNVELYVETEAYGGTLTDKSEIITIKLTGVSLDDLSFADGFIVAG